MATKKPTTIDEYIAGFPKETQSILEEVRAAIKEAAPESEEKISYAMPSLALNGKYLIYFAGYKKHIGLYPVPAAAKGFEKDYAPYKTSGKGTIQFPIDKPMPIKLIKKIVKFRVNERLAEQKNISKGKAKKTAR
jgi:uncharacterized protein YdhG (YjbR/CyaY superfamily)